MLRARPTTGKHRSMSSLLGLFEADPQPASGRLFAFFDERGRLVRDASRATFLSRAHAIAGSLLDQGLERVRFRTRQAGMLEVRRLGGAYEVALPGIPTAL